MALWFLFRLTCSDRCLCHCQCCHGKGGNFPVLTTRIEQGVAGVRETTPLVLHVDVKMETSGDVSIHSHTTAHGEVLQSLAYVTQYLLLVVRRRCLWRQLQPGSKGRGYLIASVMTEMIEHVFVEIVRVRNTLNSKSKYVLEKDLFFKLYSILLRFFFHPLGI